MVKNTVSERCGIGRVLEISLTFRVFSYLFVLGLSIRDIYIILRPLI